MTLAAAQPRDAGALAEAGRRAHAAAARAAGLTERDLVLGGVRIRVRIAGTALADRLLPALRGQDPAGAPDLVLDAFDTASSGVAMPAPPWGRGDYLPFDEVRDLTTGPVVASYAVPFAVLSLLDRDRRHGLFWARDAAAMPEWEEGGPLRNLLRWGLQDHGLAFVHAAAVGADEDHGVLLLGNGGAGKSTTSLAFAAAGLPFVADDYLLLGRDLTAHAVYGIGKLDANGLRLLPALGAAAEDRRRGPRAKVHVDVRSRLIERLPLRAIVLPRVAAATGFPRRIDGAAAVRAVLGGSLAQLPAERAATTAALAETARRLPAYALEVGPDVDVAVARIAALAREPQ